MFHVHNRWNTMSLIPFFFHFFFILLYKNSFHKIKSVKYKSFLYIEIEMRESTTIYGEKKHA